MSRLAMIGVMAAVAASALGPSRAVADCKLTVLAEFHVDPERDVPVVDGEINGQPAKILIDTGATTSLVTRAEAKRRGLDLRHLTGVHIYSVGGGTEVLGAYLKSLKIDRLTDTNVPVLVTGPSVGGIDVAYVLGDDVLSRYDVEFDLAKHVVRLLIP
jgi:predicted aspartyl protease